MIDRSFYVYVHRRLSDGTPFYVGKGKTNRAYVTFGRSPEWASVQSEHGLIVEIVKRHLSEWCAYTLEKIMIGIHSHHGLVNKTTGGGGQFQISEETRQMLRMAKLGKPQSPEHAAKSRMSKVGKRQPDSAREFTRKLKSKPIISSNGVIYSSATDAARQLAESLKCYVSQGNISAAANAGRANAYGLSWSYDTSKVPEFCPTVYRVRSIECVETGEVFNSAQDATRWVREWRGAANNQCITAAARGETKSAYGYTWEYTDAA